MPASAPPEHPFAPYVRTLGRGPGRSRALTREEARAALAMVLNGEADPIQIGAFLMLLRYRGEDPDEITGLIEAARSTIPLPTTPQAELDWPSYGAGRTRGAPWFLLAALALARAGYRVAMHGTNNFTSGTSVIDALPALNLRPATSHADALNQLQTTNFTYLPLQTLSPPLANLLNLRHLLGLRSPINTVARLLDPFNATAGVAGVFHPAYISLHLAASARLGRTRRVVVKGGGGEAERNPTRPIAAHANEWGERTFPALLPIPPDAAEPASLAAIWRGEASHPLGEATILATIELALSVLDPTRNARDVWEARPLPTSPDPSTPAPPTPPP